MKGLLIYDRVGMERNGWFINRLIECARNRGCELKLVIHPDSTDTDTVSGFDFAIVRTIDTDLNIRLTSLGIPCFNNTETSRVANDKWQTYLFAKEAGIPVMDTVRSEEEAAELGFPLVIKTIDGHGGSEVFKADNLQKCKEIFSSMKNKRLIAQRFCDEPGVDMRVYMLGKEILYTVKRTSLNDFRSNFSLGGKAQTVTPDKDVTDTAKLIARILGCDLVGIDFIRHGGRWILNEIEDVVGTRMIYANTDIDAADEYIGYILDTFKENLCTTN